MDRRRRVLLPGAGGFSGSHCLRHILMETDWDIVCPVTFTHHGLADRIRLALDDAGESALDRVKIVKHDLTSPVSSVTDTEFGPIDYVFNYASESHVDRSISHPGPFIQNNVAIMTNLLDWVRTREDIDALIHISTDEVYGPAKYGYAHREWEDQHFPSNPYAASKAAQEDILFSYWRTYDLPVAIMNVMNVIGETQSSEKFIPRAISKIVAGEPMTIHASPDGQAGSRMYLHARNKADALLHISDYVQEEESELGESLFYSDGGDCPFRFHVAGLEEIDNSRMVDLIAEVVGKPARKKFIDFHSARPGHDLRYALDSQHIQRTGWKPPVPFEESLQRTVEWTLAHPEWLRV